MEQQTEFTVLGKNIEHLSIYYGFFLFLWGVVISLLSGSTSFTSYIPSYIGSVVILFSYLSIKFSNKKKIFMHIVVLFGLIAFLKVPTPCSKGLRVSITKVSLFEINLFQDLFETYLFSLLFFLFTFKPNGTNSFFNLILPL